MNGPHRDDENEVSAFVRDETVSTYRFMWGLIIAPFVLVLVAAAITILIWRLTR